MINLIPAVAKKPYTLAQDLPRSKGAPVPAGTLIMILDTDAGTVRIDIGKMGGYAFVRPLDLLVALRDVVPEFKGL